MKTHDNKKLPFNLEYNLQLVRCFPYRFFFIGKRLCTDNTFLNNVKHYFSIPKMKYSFPTVDAATMITVN